MSSFESRLDSILALCPTVEEQEQLLRRALARLEMQKRLDAACDLNTRRRPQDDEAFDCEDQS